jgi:hypothetical protein
VITADNQQAIGRAFWGPLGDIFCIAVNPRFSVTQRLDGSALFYSPIGIEQLILVSAHKLLRPGDDPVINAIPAETRRRILALDPFIHNLDRFFPVDELGPLTDAANPDADPSINNRAELLGRWWLSPGTEVRYSVGEAKKLFSGEATELQFESTLTMSAGFVIPLNEVIGIGASTQSSFTTTVRYQSSRETFNGVSRTAGCRLIRNQNALEHTGIEVYYDKLFSSLMFRRISAKTKHGSPLVGVVEDPFDNKLPGIPIEVICKKLRLYAVTDRYGRFEIPHLPGCELRIGEEVLKIPNELPSGEWTIRAVRPVIDLARAPQWQIAKWLGISSDRVRNLARHLERVFDERDLAHVTGMKPKAVERLCAAVLVKWPSVPLHGFVNDLRIVDELEHVGVTSLRQLAASDPKQLARSTSLSNKQAEALVGDAQQQRAASHVKPYKAASGANAVKETPGDKKSTARGRKSR